MGKRLANTDVLIQDVLWSGTRSSETLTLKKYAVL